MVQLEMTGAEIKTALEQGVSNILDAGGSTGAFPYAAGLRWDVDMSQSFGNRFSSLEAKRRDETEWAPLEPAATYSVLTNSFAASGGDGYEVFADVVDDGRSTDTFLEYAQTFVDYVKEVVTISRPAIADFSTQSDTPAP
jgi:5'-nucleotidase